MGEGNCLAEAEGCSTQELALATLLCVPDPTQCGSQGVVVRESHLANVLAESLPFSPLHLRVQPKPRDGCPEHGVRCELQEVTGPSASLTYGP